jgi:hypothetical protein
MKTYWLLVVALSVVACSQQPSEAPAVPATDAAPIAETAKPEPLPTIDMRSPDSLVKSYWARQDWLAKNQKLLGIRLDIGDEMRAYMQQGIDMSAGELRAKAEKEYAELDRLFIDESAPAVYQRDIIEVKNESETRAVVVTKLRNITPMPSDIDLGIWKDDREYGLDVNYVVEKTAEGWRLSQAWKRSAQDIKLDKDSETGQPKTGGWTKVWQVTPKNDTGPSAFHYSHVEP